MAFIQNTSLSNVQSGNHFHPGENAILIQLCDPPGNFPVPKRKFTEIYQFDFLDLDEPGLVDSRDEALEEFQITQEQADELVKILQSALERDMNVIVHCHAGVCRSGAVAEVAVMMGFEDTGARRQPNVLVKKMMMRSLGWTYEFPGI